MHVNIGFLFGIICAAVANAAPEGCSNGYYEQIGDLPGWTSVDGMGGGERVSSCDVCAAKCSSTSNCKSYECSHSALHCNLNTAADPTQGAYGDYVFCTKTARYIFEWTSMNWADANAYCKATYGSQLATITSDEELAEARSAISDGGSVWAWIGLSKLSGSWEWASEQRCDYDGIRDCEDDPRWRKSTGEPNGWGNNNCAYVAVGHLYNDMPCSSGAPVLCDAVSFEEVAIVPAGWTNVGPEGASFGSGSLPGYCSYTAKGVSTEAAVIASSGIHCFKNINDGVSGNANSWIPGYTASPYFAGISFDSPRSVNGFAVARDSLGQYRDRIAGTKTLQYTTVDAPDQNTAASDWKTAGLSFKVPDASRHIYSFSEPISATGFRIVTNDPNDCIDELELFQAVDNILCDTGSWNEIKGSWSFDAKECSIANSAGGCGDIVWFGSADGKTPDSEFDHDSFVLTTEMEVASGGYDAGIMFRTGESSTTNDEGPTYYVGMYPGYDYVVFGSMDDGWFPRRWAYVPRLEYNTVHTLSVHGAGNVYSVYVDGAAVITDLVRDEFSFGSVGLRTCGAPTTYHSLSYEGDTSTDGSASAASVSHGTASEDGISSSEWSDSSIVVIAMGICIGLFIVSVLIVLTVIRKQKQRKKEGKAVEAIHVPDDSVQQKSLSPESAQKEMAVTEHEAMCDVVEVSMTAVSSEATNDMKEEAV